MSLLRRYIPIILVYRHATLSVCITVSYFLVGFFLSAQWEWYRPVLFAATGIYILLHGLIAWRLAVLFPHSADPVLYLVGGIFGLFTIVFVSSGVLLWIMGILICLLLALTTISPRMTQFSFPFVHKGWRRLYTIAWVGALFFYLSTLFGIHLFVASLPWYIPTLLGGLGMVYASFSIIRLYISDTFRAERVVYGVLWVVYTELFLLWLLLPFGLFSLALLLTWVWYLVTLLCRFALSEKGVLWSEQWRYITLHCALYIGTIMWFLRWT